MPENSDWREEMHLWSLEPTQNPTLFLDFVLVSAFKHRPSMLEYPSYISLTLKVRKQENIANEAVLTALQMAGDKGWSLSQSTRNAVGGSVLLADTVKYYRSPRLLVWKQSLLVICYHGEQA